MNNLIPVNKQALPDVTPDVLEAIEDSNAEETRRVYASAWKAFSEWMGRNDGNLFGADPRQVADYLAKRRKRGASMATLRVHRAAIRFHFLAIGLPDPTDNEGVRRVMRGLGRKAAKAGKAEQKQAAPLTRECLDAIIDSAFTPRKRGRGYEKEETAKRRGRVDIALVSIMRDALLRRSELLALTWGDLTRWPDGSGRVRIARSKTDQQGAGNVQYVQRETMERLDAIRPDRAKDSDRIFRFSGRPGKDSGRVVCERIRAMARAAKLPNAEAFSGHSPRVGMAIDLAEEGAGLPELMQAGRWKSTSMPARYTRNISAGNGAVAKYFGKP